MKPSLLLFALTALVSAGSAQAQRPGGPPPGAPGAGGPPGLPGMPPGAASKPRPYADVITKEAVTDEGLFKVHKIEEKYYWEIPESALEKEILWVSTLARTAPGFGNGGTEIGDRVVRFTKRGDRLFLRAVSYQLRTSSDGSIKDAVSNSNLEPVIQAFDIRAYAADQSAVIEIGPYFLSDPGEFSPRRSLGASGIDPGRTYFEHMKSFPRNVEVGIFATYRLGGGAPPMFFPSRGPRVSRDPGVESVSVGVRHSIVLLPEKPMKPRRFDSRVGYFTTGFFDFGSDEHKVASREYINRWRLEKKDPTAAISEPVKPIVYYVGREVPEKWRAYIRKGVEDWQEAFESAGFKNAIICKDAPTPAEDPDFDPDDTRYSVIRWLPSTVENAYGPSIVDPRTGEILESDIKIFHNLLSLNTKWYFTQASPNDARAQKLPLPDDLAGDLIRYVTAHEVGHTLGLPHNMKASSSYTVQQLRSKAFTEKNGTQASIMDYGRFNYVAQPGDGARLISKLGPYDLFSIEWGYKPIAGDEKKELDAIAARQVDNPMLRFGNASGDDPGRQTEDLGSDPVEAGELGLRNIKRVMGYLVAATTKPGEDYTTLRDFYEEVISQRRREMGHVVTVVGGVTETNYHAGRGGMVYTPVPAARQRKAVEFLIKNVLETPLELIRPDIISRIEPAGVADRILNHQLGIVASLLSEARIKRMADQRALNGVEYTPEQLMLDLRNGIFSELKAPAVKVDLYRRNLQRAYTALLAARIAPETGSAGELRSLARLELQDLHGIVGAAQKKVADRSTRAHLADLAAVIDQALDPD